MADNNNSTAPKKRRGPGRPFLPGVSGNPGGRPKNAIEARAILISQIPENIGWLIKMRDDPDTSTKDRHGIIRTMMDFSIPKPAEEVQETGTSEGLTKLIEHITKTPAESEHGPSER